MLSLAVGSLVYPPLAKADDSYEAQQVVETITELDDSVSSDFPSSESVSSESVDIDSRVQVTSSLGLNYYAYLINGMQYGRGISTSFDADLELHLNRRFDLYLEADLDFGNLWFEKYDLTDMILDLNTDLELRINLGQHSYLGVGAMYLTNQEFVDDFNQSRHLGGPLLGVGYDSLNFSIDLTVAAGFGEISGAGEISEDAYLLFAELDITAQYGLLVLFSNAEFSFWNSLDPVAHRENVRLRGNLGVGIEANPFLVPYISGAIDAFIIGSDVGTGIYAGFGVQVRCP